MRQFLLPLFLCSALAGCYSGCATLDADADPVLVRSEQAITVARGSVDRFLKWEKNNRATLNDGQLKSVADDIRRITPAAIDEALAARDLYKLTRSQSDLDALDKALKVLQKILDNIETHYRP